MMSAKNGGVQNPPPPLVSKGQKMGPKKCVTIIFLIFLFLDILIENKSDKTNIPSNPRALRCWKFIDQSILPKKNSISGNV